MTGTPDRHDDAFEVERYELAEPPAHTFAWDRREWLAALGGGLLIAVTVPPLPAAEGTAPAEDTFQDPEDTIAAWLHLDREGRVTVHTGKVEVGQDIRTSLSQAVADELGLPVDAVTMVMGDTARVPYDRGTYGSLTTPRMAPRLRRAAAAARKVLIERAAARLEAAPEDLRVRGGAVVRGDRSVSFAALTADLSLDEEIPEDAGPLPHGEWKLTGTAVPRVNGRDLVTGAHRYASDVRREGMWHGAVLRAPTLAGRPARVDLARAQAMDDVVVVHDGDFLAAAAPTTERARQALAAIGVEWERGEDEPDDGELFARLRRPGRGGRRGNVERGDVARALADAAHTAEADFEIAYIAHTPLEPRAAVAEWKDGQLTVWTGTQRPFGVHRELCRAFRLDGGRVRVLMPDTGSGYGGKHTGEAAVEAARLAKAAGRPVRLQWTRPEEFTRAYFRPAGLIRTRGGVDGDGKLVAWEFHNHNSGGSAIRPPYDVPHQKVRYHPADAPLRQGSYRALAATANVFARESLIDELARAAGVGPLAFRRANLDDDRLRAVLDAAAERFGWNGDGTGDTAQGIACGIDKGGHVATCAEVGRTDDGGIAVRRLVTAFECGAIVNPDNLDNQVEGAVVMGLGGALFEAVRFEQGRILTDRLATYRVPRFGDVPDIDTVLVDRPDLPSAGAGECPILATAPAIANAWRALTGERLHALPLRPA